MYPERAVPCWYLYQSGNQILHKHADFDNKAGAVICQAEKDMNILDLKFDQLDPKEDPIRKFLRIFSRGGPHILLPYPPHAVGIYTHVNLIHKLV